MKKKSILPLVTVTMLATALLGGCANNTETTTTSEATPTEAVKEGNSYAGQTISGEVTEIDGDTISMTPEGEEDDISFTVNDDAEITREGIGQPPEMSGDDSSNTPSEMPDGDAPSNNDGQSGNSSSDSNTPPEKPDGEAPSGNAPSDDMTTSTDASLTDIQVGDTIQVTLDDGGTYTSNGTGSPAVYSTADIAVSGATLTANGSEAVCIEGSNSLRLFDTDLTGNMSDDSQNDCTWTVTGDSHSTSVDTSDAESTTSFSDYEVTQQ